MSITWCSSFLDHSCLLQSCPHILLLGTKTALFGLLIALLGYFALLPPLFILYWLLLFHHWIVNIWEQCGWETLFSSNLEMCDIFDKKCHISIVWDLESNLHLIRSLKLTNIFESQSFVFVNFLEFRFFNFMCFAPLPPPLQNIMQKSLYFLR